MSEETKIEIGSVVSLNGDGPLMTVLSVDPTHAECFWHDRDGRPQHWKFPQAALRVRRVLSEVREAAPPVRPRTPSREPDGTIKP